MDAGWKRVPRLLQRVKAVPLPTKNYTGLVRQSQQPEKAATLCQRLAALTAAGRIVKSADGYHLATG